MCCRTFISKLPDKGKKILEFSEKLNIAILQEEELRRRAECLSTVRLEFQKKQEEIKSSKQRTIVRSNNLTQEDSSSVSEFSAPVVNKEYSSALQNDLSVWTKKRSTKNKTAPLGKTEIAAQSTGSGSSETLVDAFERISIEGRTCSEKSEKGQNVKKDRTVNDGLLQNLPNMTPKIPHYVEVLELRANNPVTQKRKFKTNM